MCVCVCSTEKLSPERVKLVMEHIWRMQEFCNSMSRMSPDAYEYAYLKAVVLFSPGEHNRSLSEKYEGNGEGKKVRMELIVCVCHRSLWSGRHPSDRTLSGESLHGTTGLCEQSVSRGHISVSDYSSLRLSNQSS